ncbi:MAG TPA: uracil-DNA glycosylase [Terracidiphilus sp.]|nr:uracil-DNA glycosylase [Terracidiphilus sp.]
MTEAIQKSVLQELAARLEFYRELGIYDFYRRDAPSATIPEAAANMNVEDAEPAAAPVDQIAHPSAASPALPSPAFEESTIPRRTLASNQPVAPLVSFGPVLPAAQRPAALAAVSDLIGDCQRCPLSQGRNKIVFADGDANAQIMFVGEGPGADEDAQGLPFVGRAGQLLNNMIGAMGLKREQVYIANIVKCRPPQNRKPEPEEAHSCMPFLERQIEIVRPRVLVALGATAATYLLGMRGSIGSMRGRIHDYRGIQTVVTYHPAFLLRDPAQKKEAWKDLQMAMAALGLKAPSRTAQSS